MNTPIAVKCADCGRELAMPSGGPCPDCGSTRRNRIFGLGIAVEVDTALSVSWIKTRKYYEKNPRALTIVAVIAVGSPFVGLVVAGPPGVLIGLALSGISFVAGLYAVTKVLDRERGGG